MVRLPGRDVIVAIVEIVLVRTLGGVAVATVVVTDRGGGEVLQVGVSVAVNKVMIFAIVEVVVRSLGRVAVIAVIVAVNKVMLGGLGKNLSPVKNLRRDAIVLLVLHLQLVRCGNLLLLRLILRCGSAHPRPRRRRLSSASMDVVCPPTPVVTALQVFALLRRIRSLFA